MQRIPLGGRPETLQSQCCGDTAGADGRRQAQQFVPAALDGSQGHAPERDGLQTFRDGEPSRHEELSLGQVPQPRAQIKAQQLGDGHRRIRVSVRVDRQQGNPNAICRVVVLLDALDGDTGLSFVEHDGLVVDDAPSVAHVGVQAGCVGTPARIDPGVPQVAGRVQRHHVGRRLVSVAPECRDGDPALELGDALVGTPQATAAFARSSA